MTMEVRRRGKQVVITGVLLVMVWVVYRVFLPGPRPVITISSQHLIQTQYKTPFVATEPSAAVAPTPIMTPTPAVVPTPAIPSTTAPPASPPPPDPPYNWVSEMWPLKSGYKIYIVDPETIPSVTSNNDCIAFREAGRIICVSTKDRFIGPTIRRKGMWEPHIWKTVKNLLNKDPDLGLIDIGANIGAFTIAAAAMGRQVLAVEAFSENVQRLSEGVRLSKLTDKVKIVYNAVSDVYETVRFWYPQNNPGGTHTVSKGVTLAPNKQNFVGEQDKIGTILLDDLPQVIPFKKAVMKIDIEGYEIKAFRNITKLLDSVQIGYIFSEFTVVKDTPACMTLVNSMRSLGYVAKDTNLNPIPGNIDYQTVRRWPGDIVWVKK